MKKKSEFLPQFKVKFASDVLYVLDYYVCYAVSYSCAATVFVCCA